MRIFFLFVATLMLISTAQAQQVKILTDVWAPYVNAEGESLGEASRKLKMLAAELDWQLQRSYLPYDQSAKMVESGKADLAYPYFKTDRRQQTLLFSKPIMQVTNRLFFNRQFIQSPNVEQIAQLRIGRVSGYSYGEKLDSLLNKAQVFANERAALQALFSNQIDLLPMTEGVMQQALDRFFSERRFLIEAIPQFAELSNLHIIAGKNAHGEQLIGQINQVIEQFRKNDIQSFLQSMQTRPLRSLDIASLVPSEGYPIVIAQDSKQSPNYFTLPNGTKVAILLWGPMIMKSSESDRIYKNMMDLSKVVILNGPHLGKELFVKNLYIQLD